MRASFGTNLAAAALASFALVACAERQRDPNDPSAMAAGAPAVRAVSNSGDEPAAGLEGHTYILQYHQRGSDELQVDTVSFSNGRIASSTAGSFGHAPSQYRSVRDNVGEAFTAVMPSTNDGQIEWSGMLVKGRLDGRAVWRKPGGSPIEYEFKGLEQ
jgi:hypothetical protein